jgi:hypothetical protein
MPVSFRVPADTHIISTHNAYLEDLKHNSLPRLHRRNRYPRAPSVWLSSRKPYITKSLMPPL